MVILTGVIRNGQQIPLPNGYTQDECFWNVSVNNVTIHEYAAPFGMRVVCAVDSNRFVTIYGSDDDFSGIYNTNCTANYTITGIKR